MKERLTLTGLWAFFFLVAVGVVVLYTEIPGEDGFLAVLPEQRMEVLQPVLTLYGLYLGGILLFWFGRPFRESRLPILSVERSRFWIALVCTVMFNLGCIALLARAHFIADANVVADVDDVVRLAKYISWIVAPANAYYFGTKSEELVVLMKR